MQCEIDTSGPVCLGDEVLLPPALPLGLVGYWSFDGKQARDSTGNGAHGTDEVQAGPTLLGQGSSALFRASYMEVPGMAQLTLRDFTYSFWFFLVDNGLGKGSNICPLLRKGRPAEAAAPSITYDRVTRQLSVVVATERGGEYAGVVLEKHASNARLSKGRWYHIAVVRLDDERAVRLYVNGILDSAWTTEGHVVENNDPLYVGSDPLAMQFCDLHMYIDELKVYSRPVSPDEIQAEASPALAGIEPSFVRLACVDCTLEAAEENCPDGYGICDTLDLHMGGYQVAHMLGWLDRPGGKAHLWSRAATTNLALQAGLEPAVPPAQPAQRAPEAPVQPLMLAAHLEPTAMEAPLGDRNFGGVWAPRPEAPRPEAKSAALSAGGVPAPAPEAPLPAPLPAPAGGVPAPAPAPAPEAPDHGQHGLGLGVGLGVGLCCSGHSGAA